MDEPQAQAPAKLEDRRTCALAGCQRTFVPPKSAMNKKFCCPEHKQQWHDRRRKAAEEFLAKHPDFEPPGEEA